MGIGKILEINPSLIVFDLRDLQAETAARPRPSAFPRRPAPAARSEAEYPEFNPEMQPYIGQRVRVEEGNGIVKLVVPCSSGVDGVAGIELIGSKEPVVKDYSLRPE